jgi:hypothetical protein
VGNFVGKNSRVAAISSLGIEHRIAVDPVPISLRIADTDTDPHGHSALERSSLSRHQFIRLEARAQRYSEI